MRCRTIAAALLLASLSYPALAQSAADHEAHHPGQDHGSASTQASSPASQAAEKQGMGAGAMGPMMGMMGRGMKDRAMMGGDTMGPPLMFRMIFALMDADGDGTVSLAEFQAAHERVFRAMDSNKDGKLTREEMLAFMQGAMSQQ